MPLYIRTRDNVVLRFEGIQDVKQWLSEGKVTMQAVFMTEDKVWKPIAELLKEDTGAAQPKPASTQPSEPVKQPASMGMEPDNDAGEPAWAPKARVILPVSDWDNDLDDDLDDDFDIDEGRSKKGILIVSFLIALAGVAIAGYILFGDRLFHKKSLNPSVPSATVAAKKALPAPPSVKRVVVTKPIKPAAPKAVAVAEAKPDTVVHSALNTQKDAVIRHQIASAQGTAGVKKKPAGIKKESASPKKPPEKRIISASKRKKAPKHARVVAKAPKKRASHIPGRRNQNTYDSHMTMGNRLLIQGDVKKAEGHFHYVLSVRPRSVEAMTKLGKCKMLLGNLNKAAEYFQSALSINNEYSPAMIGLARLYKKQGNHSQAAAYYSKYLELHPYGLNVREAKAFLGVK